MVEPVALTALMLDVAIGWPEAIYRRIGHPIGLFARIIDGCEKRWNQQDRSETRKRLFGIATVLLLLFVSVGTGILFERLMLRYLGGYGWIGIAVLAFPALAQRSLSEHVSAVVRALGKGDLDMARQAVGMIVGRDTASLDEAGIARAAIESLAESFCDGVCAPLFWLLIGGLPGIWAYKAINTADSLIGHPEPRWRAFGWAAARADDVLNLLPARLAGALICLAGMGGWRTMLRDAGKHASPNAGWPEAAIAGALDLRLAGPISYEGAVSAKPWIGNGRIQAAASDIGRALGIYRRACLLLWLIAGSTAWLS